MAQPDPHQIAVHLHRATDQINLFQTLPAIHEGATLQNILDGITELRAGITELRADIGRLRTDTNTGLARLETRLETRISVAEHNGLARTHNAAINKSEHALQHLKTHDGTEPNGFPDMSAQLFSITVPQLNALLTAYRLPMTGSAEAKRKRLRYFIGIVSDV